MTRTLIGPEHLLAAAGPSSPYVFASDSDVYVDAEGGRCERYLTVAYGDSKYGAGMGKGGGWASCLIISPSS